jgi:hypothetical protein
MSSRLTQELAAVRVRQRKDALEEGMDSPEVVFESREGTVVDELKA